MKITVRIHRANGLVDVKTRKLEYDGKVTLRKGSKNKGPWRPFIKGYETKPLSLGRVKYFTDIWENAQESWTYSSKLPPENQPELTQDEVTRIARFKVFEKRYATEPKQPGSLLWIILLLQIAGIIFTFLLASGRLRI